MASRIEELSAKALRFLKEEDAVLVRVAPPAAFDVAPCEARNALRALLTVREPSCEIPAGAMAAIDELLDIEASSRPRVDPFGLPTLSRTHPCERPGRQRPWKAASESIVLWKGDLTTLAAGAIVNAANDGLLGCFQPFHACIDNEIHSAAGPKLRDECLTVVTAHGGREPTGSASITRGYHLPAKHVIHTVGPIVGGLPSEEDAEALASCYRCCLDCAEANGLSSIGFCSISTGIFGYPKEDAAVVALATVSAWLCERERTVKRVVISLFRDADVAAYDEAVKCFDEDDE